MVTEPMQKLLDDHQKRMGDLLDKSSSVLERTANVHAHGIMANTGKPVRDAAMNLMLWGRPIDPRITAIVNQLIKHPSVIPEIQKTIETEVEKEIGAITNGE